jgi:hypothetical protein
MDGQYIKAYAEYLGRDVDSFRKTNIDYAERNCSSTSTTSISRDTIGTTCSGRIINDGWKMNY